MFSLIVEGLNERRFLHKSSYYRAILEFGVLRLSTPLGYVRRAGATSSAKDFPPRLRDITTCPIPHSISSPPPLPSCRVSSPNHGHQHARRPRPPEDTRRLAPPDPAGRRPRRGPARGARPPELIPAGTVQRSPRYIPGPPIPSPQSPAPRSILNLTDGVHRRATSSTSTSIAPAAEARPIHVRASRRMGLLSRRGNAPARDERMAHRNAHATTTNTHARGGRVPQEH